MLNFAFDSSRQCTSNWSERSVTSIVVNTRLQFSQLRRRQTLGRFLCGREFVTFVLVLPQCMQIMTIYCHTAIKNASGKLLWTVGKSHVTDAMGGFWADKKPGHGDQASLDVVS